jgi:predicted DNA-binding transcriptional regulator AlpA
MRRAWREIFNISESTGQKWQRDDPQFPKPICVGPYDRKFYVLSEIEAYLASRPRRKEAA